MIFSLIRQGAIQLIRDTLRGMGFATVLPNNTRVRRGLPKCHVTFFAHFSTIISYFYQLKNYLFNNLVYFYTTLKAFKIYIAFWNMSRHSRGGVRASVTKWHMWEGGGNRPEKSRVLFEWPPRLCFSQLQGPFRHTNA